MKIHELTLTSKTDRKRVGRGIGSGYGKTAGRGTKGQNSRTGGGVRPGFEGGQNPLAKRLPKKRGFVPLSQLTYQVVNLVQLDRFKDGTKVTIETLHEAGLVKSTKNPVKLLGRGETTKKLALIVQAASKAATEAITKAGGTVTITALTKTKTSISNARPKPTASSKEVA